MTALQRVSLSLIMISSRAVIGQDERPEAASTQNSKDISLAEIEGRHWLVDS